MATDPDPIKLADTTLRVMESRVRTLSHHLDKLYEKGKKDGWPKEVMDYIMWFEHEVCRLPTYMPADALTIRKGLYAARREENLASQEKSG